MIRPVKIIFSFTGVWVLIRLFDFLLENTRIKEHEKTRRKEMELEAEKSRSKTTKKKTK